MLPFLLLLLLLSSSSLFFFFLLLSRLLHVVLVYLFGDSFLPLTVSLLSFTQFDIHRTH